MTQTVVLNKLAEFLKQTDTSGNEELLVSFKKGYCHGMSICFGAMAVLDKLSWWSDALRAIAAWDETPAKLAEKISLYGSIDDTSPTLGNIFERVLNYLVFFQTDKVATEFRTANISLVNILNPADNHFEMLGTNGEIKKIKKLENFAGYFTANHLYHLLDEQLITDSLCIIEAPNHSISIAYKDFQWSIYDPNYPHDALYAPIYKKIAVKTVLINEIISIQGNSLVIRVALFKNEMKETSANYYNSILHDDAEILVNEFGLHKIIKYAPEKLPILMNRLSDSDKGLALIVKGLAAQPPGAISGINIYQTGLKEMIQRAPQHLPLTLKLVGKSKDGIEKVSELITQTDIYGWSDLRSLAQNLPQYLSIAFELVSQSKNGLSLLSEALAAKAFDGWTLFHVVLHYSPQQLLPVLELAEQSGIGKDLIVESLATAPQGGWNVLQTIKNNAPQHLSKLHEFAAKSKKCPDEIALNIMTDAIKNNNCVLASLLLLNANSLELREQLIKKISINFHGELDNKRTFAIGVIKQVIQQLKTPFAIRQFIFHVQINNENSNYIFARRGLLTTYSLYGHCWNGYEVSGSWVGIVNFAKQRILDLFQQNNFENVADDDLHFLRMKTVNDGFFKVAIDYDKKYQAMRQSHSQLPSASMGSQ